MTVCRIRSIDEYERLRTAVVAERRKYEARVLVCMTGCRALGAAEVCQAFREGLASAGLAESVDVVETGCIGLCASAPVVLVEPYDFLYGKLKPADVPKIVETTLRSGQPVEDLLVRDEGAIAPHLSELSFYGKQKRRVLANCGRIDPTKIEHAIATGTYAAVLDALHNRSPEDVIDEVTQSGLRGRGGAGFPTGVKWGLCRKSPGGEKVLVCNADEGDPGAFMDRALKEGDPHRVIEGMIIAAYAIGASQGFIYVRAEYPIAVKHIGIALSQAREAGLLGEDIGGSGFSFDIEVRKGAGAFVCGEETALIASLEGGRGMPRPRPPFPAQRGYEGKPTNINNVETFANVPVVLQSGGAGYSATGTEDSKGTKIFALAGKVTRTGLVEVPMGTTLREIVFDIGGGVPGNRRFKAAQTGGPSGGCIPARFLDLPMDYGSLKQIGAIMGSGGLIVMDERTCMVDLARFFLEFTQRESCGKCAPCRVGTRHMVEILRRICSGDGREEDLDALERLGHDIQAASLCGLGQTAPNPVLTTLKYFREEYEEHIRRKHCRASVCEALIESPCSHACPAGVNIPQYIGLIAESRLADAARIIRLRNPFVSVCGRVCDSPCERRCRRADVDEPLAIRALKRYAADHSDARPLLPPAQGPSEVAIVGAGPAGLSCAYFLALMRRPSTIFEVLPIAGGMLAVGIPEYRLPKPLLQEDIDFIVQHGVTLRTNTRVDDVRKLTEEGFKAVFVATGAHHGTPLRVEGEDLDGVVDALDILRERGLGNDVTVGRHVVVIGGGNTAVDAARSCLRLGAEKVTICYRRTREEMPAYDEEIEEALAEGIELHELTAPARILGEEGRVCGIALNRMRLGNADENGRRRPVQIEDSEFGLSCDMVLPAIGQRPSVEAIAGDPAYANILADAAAHPSGATTVPGVFAGGDVVNGGGTVIEAIGAGQRAAQAIDRFLGGPGVLPPNAGFSLWRPSEKELRQTAPRAVEAILPADRRCDSFAEVLGGLACDQAVTEAARCFRCDLERLMSGHQE